AAPVATTDPAPAADIGSRPAPLPPPGEMARCKALIDAGQYAAARARLEPIVELHPGWARASLLLGLTYYKENRFEAAVPLFAQALEADPEEIAIRPFYGWSLYSLGDLDGAEQVFESLLEAKPDYTAAHYGLGVIHLDRDEVEPARTRFATTVRLAAGQADPAMEGRARARLGELALRLDDLATARRELELAVELSPDDADALFKLSRVLQRLGEDGAAAQARQRFEEMKARPPERP
ncbi:MAG: tetratricopeptide repeat protein, partial [Chloroflexi bacterium]|nr:tetratricopeptide repeat protein [Chloroflexota bacterium]